MLLKRNCKLMVNIDIYFWKTCIEVINYCWLETPLWCSRWTTRLVLRSPCSSSLSDDTLSRCAVSIWTQTQKISIKWHSVNTNTCMTKSIRWHCTMMDAVCINMTSPATLCYDTVNIIFCWSLSCGPDVTLFHYSLVLVAHNMLNLQVIFHSHL